MDPAGRSTEQKHPKFNWRSAKAAEEPARKKKIQPSNTLEKALWCWVHSRNILILKVGDQISPRLHYFLQQMTTAHVCILDFDDEKAVSLPQMSRSLTCSITATSPQQVLWRNEQFSKSIGIFTLWQQEGFILFAQRRCLPYRHKHAHYAPKRQRDGWWLHEYKGESVFLHSQRSRDHKRKRTCYK